MSSRGNILLPALMFAAAVVFGATIGNPDAASVTVYKQVKLVSNNLGAPHRDKKLVNPWGIASLGSKDPFWINDEGTGFSGLIDGTGRVLKPLSHVVVPPPTGARGHSHPTGIVANTTNDFMMSGGPAQFIFATLDGTIAAWNGGPTATTEVDNSTKAAYTGLTMATGANGSRLYAASSTGIDVFDGTFAPVTTKGNFTDSHLPGGLTPYGIANIVDTDGANNIFVTYSGGSSVQGVVDEFDTDGNLTTRFATGGAGVPLNSPWAVTMAPARKFGTYNGALLVGNFGDGTIDAFNFKTLQFLGQLRNTSGKTLTIPGLWALTVGGNAAGVSNPNALYFTAGPNNQKNGLFGYIIPGARATPTSQPTSSQTCYFAC